MSLKTKIFFAQILFLLLFLTTNASAYIIEPDGIIIDYDKTISEYYTDSMGFDIDIDVNTTNYSCSSFDYNGGAICLNYTKTPQSIASCDACSLSNEWWYHEQRSYKCELGDYGWGPWLECNWSGILSEEDCSFLGNCLFNGLNCTPNPETCGACGDGTINSEEECGEPGLSNCGAHKLCQACQCVEDCSSDGYCNPNCSNDPDCSLCGNGVVNIGEKCGETGLNCEEGETCVGCKCFEDTKCGDGVVDFGEQCGEPNLVCDEPVYTEPVPANITLFDANFPYYDIMVQGGRIVPKNRLVFTIIRCDKPAELDFILKNEADNKEIDINGVYNQAYASVTPACTTTPTIYFLESKEIFEQKKLYSITAKIDEFFIPTISCIACGCKEGNKVVPCACVAKRPLIYDPEEAVNIDDTNVFLVLIIGLFAVFLMTRRARK